MGPVCQTETTTFDRVAKNKVVSQKMALNDGKRTKKNIKKRTRTEIDDDGNEKQILYAGQVNFVHQYIYEFKNKQKRHQKTFWVPKFNSEAEAKQAAKNYGTEYCRKNGITNIQGCVYERQAYVYRMTTPKEYKEFNVKNYSSKEETYKVALTSQKKRSSELNLDKQVGMKDVTIEQQQMISGFFEGDGSVAVKKKRSRTVGQYDYLLRICFAQSCNKCVPPILRNIQELYGGILSHKPAYEKYRKQWLLDINGRFAIKLLEHLNNHCMLKLPQIKIALRFVSDISTGDMRKCEEYYQVLQKMKEKSEYLKVDIDESRLNSMWLVGFWCAEGSVGVYADTLSLSFSQHSSINLLHAIQTYYTTHFGLGGHIHMQGCLYYSSNQAAIIVDSFLLCNPQMKKDQLELAKRFIEIRTRNNPEALEERQMIAIEMKQLKKL